MTKVAVLESGSGLPSGVHGAADPKFECLVRTFASLFPSPRFGGGALSVYVDGEPAVDVWTGWADRQGETPWAEDTGAMVFSCSKGVAATVLHRLADRGELSYDAPVADYWPEFGANDKADITVRDLLRHRAGLSHMKGVSKEELLDHRLMEERMAAAPADRHFGRAAYHAFTYGWLVSGLARAITGKGMRELFRTELAQPLNTDGLHLGRPSADAPTNAAQIMFPQSTRANPLIDHLAPRLAELPVAGGLGAMYVPGITSLIQGDTPFLDSEIPSVNAVVTARAVAKMYGALANEGRVGDTQLVSAPLARDLLGKTSLRPDLNLIVPMSFHLGYHGSPVPGLLRGFGHAGLGGTIGWADPVTKSSFAFVHNRLVTPILVDQILFVPLILPLRRAVGAAHERGFRPVPEFGAPYPVDRTASAGR
ncbi:serine hydrolase domain-containing protein [Mycobacterium bourgelatii]|uniref:Lipase LipD n=1 Tax=Mycobacterium bourgelatii TaxID=1273442 RepID=A0A7I9YXF4_MYCBU|nr:serine hydrolase domain-containing protein [Mycobacterium bourgelatii]MCV6977117.1 beta-lactamase family protein [Mycobacterium bourgelatii]GFG93399.1 lipase LipD [Mycobacterium bourgelatii]